MKTLHLIYIVLMFVLLAGCNSDQSIAPIADDLMIDLDINPDPPTVGKTTLMISVHDADGNPIDGATIEVHGDMDHEGMTPIDRQVSNSQEGTYHIPFEWSMGGGWILEVTVTLPDNKGIAHQTFDLFVGAISENSIVNQGNTDTAEMDHNAMGNIDSNIQIHYMPNNDPALAGDTTITVMLTSKDGLPIDDASIALHANMPSHDMMPVMGESHTGTNGRYTIPVRWTMAGEWEVNITATLSDNQESTQTFTQIVIMPEDSDTETDDMSDHNSSG